MTPEEIKALDLTKETWNAFLELPVLHRDDQREFNFHIHAIQNIILSREGIRKMEELIK